MSGIPLIHSLIFYMAKYLILCITIILAVPVTACDVCGSGPGNYYNGLLPHFRKHFIGLRFQQSRLQAHLGPDGRATYLSSRERSSVMEVWGGTQLGSRFRVMFSLPYTMIRRDAGGIAEKQSGPGDINLVGYYDLLSPKEGQSFRQTLWIGGGVKLPTGRYNEDQENIGLGMQNNFQLGSGSVDFSTNLVYDAAYKNTGINASLACRFNTANRYGYRYGNRFTANLLIYQQVRISDRFSIRPNGGLLLESSAKDEKVKGITVWNSGGHSESLVGGLEISSGKINIGANVQSPVAQHIAEKRVRLDSRFMAYVSFSFP
ncbi:MAG: transporter [Chitinophagaceae bacterium]|nr:MAG: transporter [Chitinophagaceae bacterium]